MKQKSVDRFRRFTSDPRFKRLKSRVKQDEIDKDRFGALFTDPDFQLGTTIDKRGNQNKQRKNVQEDLERYYRLKDTEEETNQTIQTTAFEKQPANQQLQSKSIAPKQEQQFEEEEDEDLGDEVNRRMMRIRGMLNDEAQSSSDDDERDNSRNNMMDDDNDDEVELIQQLEEKEVDLAEWGVGVEAANPEEHISMVDHASKRLAIVDLLWSKIRAEDILLVMRSFVPDGGIIKCVTVYPSDYGLEQMKNESLQGPQIIFNQSQPIQESADEQDADDSDLDELKQRLVIYERSKLRWYYAVVECDSVHTAEVLYNECDGLEFEGTACKFDLRYIPDDMSFHGRDIRDQATQVSNSYKPPIITGQNPMHTNPTLTWDKDCDERKQALKFNKKSTAEEMEFDDYRAYLASSSSEDDDNNHKQQILSKQQKFKQLINNSNGGMEKSGWDNRFGAKTWAAAQNDDDGEDDDDDHHIQVTFTPALESLQQQSLQNYEREQAANKGLSVWKERQKKIRERNTIRQKQGRRVDEENDDQLDAITQLL
eukprot:TRINITY_DN5607_c0_g2_i1.p1 TRINITY_DN5607_c0_g2~~TRINITY_DN5607_c0_g2_i1.p1  ORF type:complete len:539 (-),score=130.25 TRINITY_DN5607_c0_g2_i1:1309-2925(-)